MVKLFHSLLHSQYKKKVHGMSQRLYRLLVLPGTRRISLINAGSVTPICFFQSFLSAVPLDHPLPFLGSWYIGSRSKPVVRRESKQDRMESKQDRMKTSVS
jgi:hypothetical protein|uniref:Uncharacterized protein n=1 Tax=Picea glauca TaxID=3330 RepID=A0A101LZQ5_PICGL|nr:hypothetical protein ABT39_MTgene5325 [Picea glauca]QHR88904.1 hypothetical protein Q903MT_gene2923 [Picea sitchensis]